MLSWETGGVMLKGIFGNKTAERVLLYLEQYGDGYGRAIAATFEDVSVSMALAQLKRFEAAGILVSRRQGRTLVFSWNPRSIFVEDVRALLRKALDALPEEERKRYFRERQRPRRSGKPK
jgi:DNA-binding transcriptional ArsR family regulator